MSRAPNLKVNAERDHGMIVWGRLSSKNEAWAGIVISTKKLDLLFEEKENFTWVFWIHQETFSHLKNHLISDFVQNLELYSKNIKSPRKNNVIEAIKLLFQQYGFKEPINIFNQNVLLPKVKTDIQKMTFNTIGKSNRQHSWFISGKIIEVMKNVNTKNIHQTIKKNIKQVQQHTHSKSKFCIACRSSANSIKHPIFCGFLCDKCFSKGKAIDSLMSVATDGSNITCSICFRTLKDFRGGLKLVLCNFCVRSYCSECLSLYCGDYHLNIILKAPLWKCIACNPGASTCALRKRIVKEQLNNVYSLFPAVDKICIEHKKVKAREICVLTSETVIVSRILKPYGFPFKTLFYKDDNNPKLKFKHYKPKFDKFKLELENLDHQHVAKLLISCYSTNEIRGNVLNQFGAMEAFFNFFKLKCVLGDFGLSFFWAFESCASITVEEQDTITRFCGKRPILIGTNTADVRQRGRFIWTNITILANDVQMFRKYNIFLANLEPDERDMHADGDEKPLLYNSLYATLNSLLKNNLELEA